MAHVTVRLTGRNGRPPNPALCTLQHIVRTLRVLTCLRCAYVRTACGVPVVFLGVSCIDYMAAMWLAALSLAADGSVRSRAESVAEITLPLYMVAPPQSDSGDWGGCSFEVAAPNTAFKLCASLGGSLFCVNVRFVPTAPAWSLRGSRVPRRTRRPNSALPGWSERSVGFRVMGARALRSRPRDAIPQAETRICCEG